MFKKKSASASVKKTEVDIKQLKSQLAKVGNDVAALIKHGKERYEAVDSDTKKKAAAALGGLVALLAARSVVKKVRRAGKSQKKK